MLSADAIGQSRTETNAGVSTPGASGKRRANIDFEDQLIEGQVRKPELFYLLQKKQINFGRLIKMRDNFLPEMQRSAEHVQRGRVDE